MTYQHYEWTAFTEADFLNQGGNGSSINNGDTFTMPGAATVTMSTWDNDGTLSGDNHDNATDHSGQHARIDGARVGSQLYAEKYHILHGSDGKTYYMIEIEVEGYNAPGAGDDFFTFYGQVPPAGVELTVAGCCNVSGHWVDYRCLSAGEDAPANTPPTFTNVPENGIICVDENTSFVINLDSTDAEGDAVTYEIVGGRDAEFFEIDAHTGELVFKGAPDFENPQSGGNNNTYDVTVRVTDSEGDSTTKPLWVKVKDVDEPTGPVCITIEAEDMNKHNFNTQHGNNASGGELVRINHLGQSGDLSTTFNGESGNYDLTLFAQDESDGQSVIMVKVNGVVVDTITLDNDNNGGGSNNGHFSEFVVQDIALNTGDTIGLWAQSDSGEYVRIDKIELCQDGEVCDAKLDFEGLGRGTVVSDQFDGVTISAQRATHNTAENDAMIFDSNNPTGGDHDLGYQGRGNILIISEDNDSSDPDDAVGGTITFDFDNPSDLKNIVLLDIEEAGGTIVLTFEDGTTETIAIPAVGNNSAQTVDLSAANVVSMDINLVGSGAVDDLCWTPGDAPAPASLGGTYFMDNNDNSVEDAGDMAVAGATVWLLQNGTIIDSTTTDANGDYLFEGLAPGDYSVRFDEQDGKSFVDANVGGDDTIDSDVTNVGGAGNGNTDTITLGAGEDKRDVDAGIELIDTGDAQISGRITFDADDDDTENAAGGGFDEGFGGKTVELLDENGDVIATTTTNASGAYSFTGLDAGTYSVNFPDRMGLVIADKDVGAEAEDSDANANGQTDAIVLGIGDNVPNIDLSLQDPADASLGGRIFHDSDNDSQDNGNGDEAPAPGVTVRLLDAAGNELDTAITDANGEYLFENLKAGDYKVDFPLEVDGKVLVDQNVGPDASDSDASQTTGETDVVSVGISENVRDVDAGVEDPGTGAINGRLFMDSDDDSQDNGEMGVGGIEVELLDGNGDVIDTTTTNDDGTYSFTGLAAGDYAVRFPTDVDGKVLVEQNVGPDATDSDADQGTGVTDPITLAIGDVSNDNDAGIEDPGTASLAGVVFMDNNDNSQNDAGDMAVGGVSVDLLDENGDVIDTTTTAADGSYEFTGLDAGTYSVRFPTDVDGKVLVDSNVGPDATDSDADQGTGETGQVTLGIGERSENNDAGIEDPNGSAIEGVVFMDNNDNSQNDAGDMPVAGVPVDLLDENGDVIDSTVTGADGSYAFTGLAAGTYSVDFPTEFEGKVLVDANVGPDASDSDATQPDGTTGQIVLGINETSSNNDAGIEDPGTAAIGDTVFLDENGNGRQDAGEDGVGGVDVIVRDANGNVAGTATTNADGTYLVGGLDAGDYTVEFEEVDGFDFTTANAVGVDDAEDSDADQTTGVTGTVSLEIGETDLTVDAGLVAENVDPETVDDEGMVCAEEVTTINVLANDSDVDGDTLSVAHVNGEELAAGDSTTLDSGATVTLNADGTLSYDSTGATLGGVAVEDILIGDVATDSFSYSITDGNGGTATGEVNVTVKGDFNTVETILTTLPTSGSVVFSDFTGPEAYTATLSGTGDARLDGLTISAAYCLERDAQFVPNVEVIVDIDGGLDSLQEQSDFANLNVGTDLTVGGNTIQTGIDDNLDLINWIINQDFTSVDNGDGTGETYTDAEVQLAIWGITDNLPEFNPSPVPLGTDENVLEILDLAFANGEGFEAGEGDLFTLVLNPEDLQPNPNTDDPFVIEFFDHDQSFIIALPFDEYKEDCIC